MEAFNCAPGGPKDCIYLEVDTGFILPQIIDVEVPTSMLAYLRPYIEEVYARWDSAASAEGLPQA